MWPTQFRVYADQPLVGDFDWQNRLTEVPETHTNKGMFLQSSADTLTSSELNLVRSQLKSPPRSDKFLPFTDYPLVDFTRISCVAALAKMFPHVSTRQALRLLGRIHLEVFAQSVAGHILFELSHDIESALSRVPDGFSITMKSSSIGVQRIKQNICLIFRNHALWLDCLNIGVIEGLVLHYKKTPVIDVELFSALDANYVISWH